MARTARSPGTVPAQGAVIEPGVPTVGTGAHPEPWQGQGCPQWAGITQTEGTRLEQHLSPCLSTPGERGTGSLGLLPQTPDQGKV